MKETHDLNRRTIDGKETFDIVGKNARNLLKSFDEVVAMSVITKNNLNSLSKNVEYLIEMGFKCINLLFDYSQDWQDEDLDEIRKQYNKIAEIYANKILQECDVEIPLIDDKIKTYIKEEYNCNEDCKFGMKTINIGTDGNFYPCMQFVNNKDLFHFSYQRYLINCFRNNFGLEGTPVRLIVREKGESSKWMNLEIKKVKKLQ